VKICRAASTPRAIDYTKKKPQGGEEHADRERTAVDDHISDRLGP